MKIFFIASSILILAISCKKNEQTPVQIPDTILSLSQDSLLLGDTLKIEHNTSSNLNYYWDFGDGSTYSGITPSHYYKSTGSYLIKLEVKDSIGNKKNHESKVVVGAKYVKGIKLTNPFKESYYAFITFEISRQGSQKNYVMSDFEKINYQLINNQKTYFHIDYHEEVDPSGHHEITAGCSHRISTLKELLQDNLFECMLNGYDCQYHLYTEIIW